MKKKIFNWLFALVMLPCMLFVNGCGKDDDKNPEDNKPTIYQVSNNAYIATSYNVTTDDLTLSLNTKEELMEYHFYTRLVFNATNGVEYQSWIGDSETGSWDLENAIKGTYTQNENSITGELNSGTSYAESIKGVVGENTLTLEIDEDDAEGTIVYTKIAKQSSTSSVAGKTYIVKQLKESRNDQYGQVQEQLITDKNQLISRGIYYKLVFFDNKVLVTGLNSSEEKWVYRFNLLDYSQNGNTLIIDSLSVRITLFDSNYTITLENDKLSFQSYMDMNQTIAKDQLIFELYQEYDYTNSSGQPKGNSYVIESHLLEAPETYDEFGGFGLYGKDQFINYSGTMSESFVNYNDFALGGFYKKVTFNENTIDIYDWDNSRDDWKTTASHSLSYSFNNGKITIVGDNDEYFGYVTGKKLYIHKDYGTSLDEEYLTMEFGLVSTRN